MAREARVSKSSTVKIIYRQVHIEDSPGGSMGTPRAIREAFVEHPVDGESYKTLGSESRDTRSFVRRVQKGDRAPVEIYCACGSRLESNFSWFKRIISGDDSVHCTGCGTATYIDGKVIPSNYKSGTGRLPVWIEELFAVSEISA